MFVKKMFVITTTNITDKKVDISPVFRTKSTALGVLIGLSERFVKDLQNDGWVDIEETHNFSEPKNPWDDDFKNFRHTIFERNGKEKEILWEIHELEMFTDEIVLQCVS